MHLDTVFTFCDRDLVTIYEPVVSQILPILFIPGGDAGVAARESERSFLEEVQDALGLERLQVVTTGGDEFEAERNQCGTTGTTSSRWSRESWLPTSATKRPTSSSKRPGSRYTRSRGPSSAVGAAADTA